MRYRVSFTKSAEREFDWIPKWAWRRFVQGFDQMEVNPYRSVRGLLRVHPLHGRPGYHTMVVARYRGIYHLEGDEVVFTAFRLRPVAYKDIAKV
jgi:mRNA-degrading endonuclease RelE of RelBE toxin-antitoxin system